MQIPFEYTYRSLPSRAWSAQKASPVPAPRLMAFNDALAKELNLPDLNTPEGIALLSGNATPEGALAMAYAGHQFGNLVPSLGDGRALLLGEIATAQGRFDLQLKGSGPTPFSRGGDGRAWLGPVLREYLMSEAFHALGIPTTRALAALTTGETIQRETPRPGAILARVAASHLRVGTFEYFAIRQDEDALGALCDYAIARHYPDAKGPAGLLAKVVQAQAHLVARWMSVGFIHGVMNTDNCTISGETIDFGPAAMMDSYHPARVFSQIDQRGRYAYANQPRIAHWNLAQLASALLPLMPDEDAAVADFTEIINDFPALYEAEWLRLFCAKIGLPADETHRATIEDLLHRMAEAELDFTATFAGLATAPDPRLGDWLQTWRERNPDQTAMAKTNPHIVPRLHLIQATIDAATSGNLIPFERLSQALAAPFTPRATNDPLALLPTPKERVHFTTCGT